MISQEMVLFIVIIVAVIYIINMIVKNSNNKSHLNKIQKNFRKQMNKCVRQGKVRNKYGEKTENKNGFSKVLSILRKLIGFIIFISVFFAIISRCAKYYNIYVYPIISEQNVKDYS